MLTDTDIEKLSSILATKHDFELLRSEVTSLRESTNSLTTAVDGLAKAIEDFRIEYAAITAQLGRHEQWIQQLAEKMGVKLQF